MFDLSKIFKISKKFALPDTLLKFKNYRTDFILKLIILGNICQIWMSKHLFLCFQRSLTYTKYYIHINQIKSPYQIMGKNLLFINSANSGVILKNSTPLTFSRVKDFIDTSTFAKFVLQKVFRTWGWDTIDKNFGSSFSHLFFLSSILLFFGRKQVLSYMYFQYKHILHD